jgi:MFS family permease
MMCTHHSDTMTIFMEILSKATERRLHFAWIVAGVTFFVLLVTAGIRAAPGVLMVPLEAEFGWSSAAISGAIAVNLALFGLIGPFAASLMDRWGLRRVVLLALSLLAISVGLTTLMKSLWQLVLLWEYVLEREQALRLWFWPRLLRIDGLTSTAVWFWEASQPRMLRASSSFFHFSHGWLSAPAGAACPFQ